MLKFNKAELRDKIYACWIGKNIGGTLGGPFEGKRSILDCTGFTTEPGTPLPNDDLDLQLIWLKAVSERGLDAINAEILGEYWLEYITPFWSEYGISKANMRSGLMPTLAGQYRNHMKHSNGAWIRTEIWACLFPGDVETACRAAYEDAVVDHGVGEGTYAAIFVASIEAAAFVISDIRKLIEIGLTKIPQDSRMYKFVTKVIECYDSNLDWKEARNAITDMSLADEELGWFQAPANVGYAVIGLLYGEGDFKNSMLIACNCGDDTDCSCATVGSIMGIMHGTKIIPEDWRQYIGDSILTISISYGAISIEDREFIKTCTSLTDKVMEVQAVSLSKSNTIISENEPSDFSDVSVDKYCGNEFAMSLTERSEYFTEHKSLLADCIIEYERAPEIRPNESISLKISLNPNKLNFVSQKNFSLNWFLPEGWTVEGEKTMSAHRWNEYESVNSKITAGENVNSKNKIILEISCEGHYSELIIPIILFG